MANLSGPDSLKLVGLNKVRNHRDNVCGVLRTDDAGRFDLTLVLRNMYSEIPRTDRSWEERPCLVEPAKGLTYAPPFRQQRRNREPTPFDRKTKGEKLKVIEG